MGLEQGETKATQPSLPVLAGMTVVLCSLNTRNTFHEQKLTHGRLSVRDGKYFTLYGFGVVFELVKICLFMDTFSAP